MNYASASSTLLVEYKINTNFPNLNMGTKFYTIDSSGNVTTPDIIDLSYPRYLYLSIEGINSSNQANLPDLSFKNMFAKLPVNCNFGELINYEPTPTPTTTTTTTTTAAAAAAATTTTTPATTIELE